MPVVLISGLAANYRSWGFRLLELRPVWKPMHMQPVFKGCRMHGGDVCKDLFKRGLCLPSGTAMTERDLNRVIGIVRKMHTAHK